jgi:hypothetical protein
MATTVISSSICKYFEPHGLTTQVYPGCTTRRLLKIISRSAYSERPPRPGQRDIDFNFDNFILYIGGNDISDGVPWETVVQNICEIVLVLRHVKPWAMICISGLLPRPREPEYACNIRAVNRRLRQIFDIAYIPSHKRFLHCGMPRLGLYRRDGVHLSRQGTRSLQRCFLNVAAHLP